MSKRPDMRDYFRARIDYHVNGLMAWTARRPNTVERVEGDVTDHLITVHMRDGSIFEWTGGRYANHKVNGCYAPLMPKPVAS